MRLWLAVLSTLCFCSPGITKKCDKHNTPESPGYKLASEMLLKSINFSVDPCVDFFAFSCGNWIAAHPIPDDETVRSQANILSDIVLEQRRDAFESPQIFTSKSMNALKSIYHKCMDEKEVNRIGPKQFLQTIKNYGVWPMVDGDEKWRVEDFNLTSLMIHVSKVRGLQVFVAYRISVDDRNASRRLIEFDQASLGLDRDYYLNQTKYSKNIEAYKQFLINQVRLIRDYANRPSMDGKIERDVNEVVEFEEKIAKIMVAGEDKVNRTRTYNLRRLNNMEKLTPMIDWSGYFRSIAPPSLHKYFAANPDIVVAEPDYMRNVSKLLHSTDPRIITNYFFTQFVFQWSGELGERFDNVSQEFVRMMYGQKRKAPRWKECASQEAIDIMKYATDAIYVSKVFDQAAKNSTLKMVNDIKDAFHKMLLEEDWMDNTTKEAASEKIQEMLIKVAYPEFILDSRKLDNYYDNFSVEESDSYSQMVEKVSRWNIVFNLKRLPEPVDRTEYDFRATEVNAFYEPNYNSIGLTAAFLQAPFFHPSFPRAINYGGLGATIGHEITHGFDDSGKQYDAFGNLRDWWNANTSQKYAERAQCIIDQYGNIEVPGTALKLNGKLTLGENIADNGGLKLAYKAYKKHLEVHGREERIKGLEKYNNDEMFFIGYATSSCGYLTHDQLIDLILTDPHSPYRYRVNLVVANQPEFAAAFKCAAGTPMNPAKRCAVW